MATTRAKKEIALGTITERLKTSCAVVFTAYKGLSVGDLEGVRRTLRESKVDYQVAKKTLIKKAIKERHDIEISDAVMEGPVGIAYGYEDGVSICKVLSQISTKLKKAKKEFQLLGGVVDGKEINASMVLMLSKMLSRPELLAKFAGMIKSPLNKFGGCLASPLTSFARALNEYAKIKEETN